MERQLFRMVSGVSRLERVLVLLNYEDRAVNHCSVISLQPTHTCVCSLFELQKCPLLAISRLQASGGTLNYTLCEHVR